MNNIKILMTLLGLFALASCAGHQVRLSGGAALTELHGEAEDVKDTAPGGVTYRGRIELNRAVPDFERVTAGAYVDGGASGGFDENEPVSTKHLAGGAIFRYHFLDEDATVRPFAEVRAGYRHTWLDVGQERGNGPGLDAGGGFGLEFGPAFILLEYSTGIYSIDDFDARTDEFGVMIGGKLDF